MCSMLLGCVRQRQRGLHQEVSLPLQPAYPSLCSHRGGFPRACRTAASMVASSRPKACRKLPPSVWPTEFASTFYARRRWITAINVRAQNLSIGDIPIFAGGQTLGQIPTLKAILPAMKKKAVAAIRTRPETVMPAHFFKSHAVSGHAASPDNSANQPFVSGSGPFVHKSHNPPPPATIAHAQAAIQPSLAPNLPTVTEFCFSMASAPCPTRESCLQNCLIVPLVTIRVPPPAFLKP